MLNLPDPALTPYVHAIGPQAEGAATQLSSAYNGALAQAMGALAALPQVHIRQFDTDVFLHTVVAAPARYGLQNVTDPCLAFGVVTNVVCADPDHYLFWDGIHPTRAAHLIISFAVLRTSIVASNETQH